MEVILSHHKLIHFWSYSVPLLNSQLMNSSRLRPGCPREAQMDAGHRE